MEDRVGAHYVLQSGHDIPQGNLSIVRRAVDVRDLSAVAVKFVAAGNDDITLRLFERETKALRALNHRNIVKFRDSGIDDSGTYYLVLEWVNRNLKQVIAERPWKSWGDLYRGLVRPLLEGLSYAHLKHLEHRDIKPANILIDDDGQPLLADFGIAKLRGDEPHSEHTVQGFRSGPYAPPELEAEVPYVRDVYSVGVVIAQCLSKNEIVDYPSLRSAIEDAEAPPKVKELLESCVAYKAADRPSNASELAALFRDLWLDAAAEHGQGQNALWLDLTRAASDHVRDASDRPLAPAAFLAADLSGVVHVEFGLDRESGERDRNRLLLYGSELRYSVVVDSTGKLTIVAAKSVTFEELESGRRRSMAVPPIFGYSVVRPLDMQSVQRTWNRLCEFLDSFYVSRDQVGVTDAGAGDEVFDLWLRILDARAELARGKYEPIRYKSHRLEGRRAHIQLIDSPQDDLVGTAWEIFDPDNDRRFGNGEVIAQDGTAITLLSGRDFKMFPRTGSLRPFDAPSAISIARQRAALVSIASGLSPNPNFRSVLLNPGANAAPSNEDVDDWFVDLDEAKRTAVRMAIGASEALVIEGPPGTGKTRFIVETVSQYLRRNPTHRVLIASQTHVAVDNAVERLDRAGMSGVVRLAGADESQVAPAVRPLLLERQMPTWADGVRRRATENIAQEAKQFGLNVDHARAALVLEQFIAASNEYERVEDHIDQMLDSDADASELRTAVEDQDPTENLRGRLEHLDARRAALSAEAQLLLGDALTIPARFGSEGARQAISAVLGDDSAVRGFLERLRLQAEWMERIESDDGLMATFLAGSAVVAGTCIGLLRSRVVAELEFDLCIVDEASRATLTEALVPMARSKRWILVGDTRQLPPSDEDLIRAGDLLVEHQITADDVKETLFQRMVNHLPAHSQLMLDEQYRMIKPIGDLISTCFYDGQLKSSRTFGLEGLATYTGGSVVWLDTSGLGETRKESNRGITSIANRSEASILIAQLDSLDAALDFGLVKAPSPERLAVLAIAPYKSQVDDLARRLASKSYRHLNVTPISVDAVQGREADLAFFSVTRSNDDRKIGFLGADYWRRINVALSRARFGLTIIGDASFVRSTNSALKRVLEYVESNPLDCVVREARL